MTRTLLPREHGAYGQLALPLVTALAMGRPGGAALALTLAAIAAFLLHQPVLLLATRRESRARDLARTARRLERSLVGENVLAGALAGQAAPAAIAGGISPAMAGWTWATWTLGFAAVTCAVHGAVVRRKHRDPVPALVASAAITLAAIVLASTRPDPLAACLPLVAAAIALIVTAPSPRRLRTVGWTLMAASAASAVWLVALRA
jgi:hypothetical protein